MNIDQDRGSGVLTDEEYERIVRFARSYPDFVRVYEPEDVGRKHRGPQVTLDQWRVDLPAATSSWDPAIERQRRRAVVLACFTRFRCRSGHDGAAESEEVTALL